MRTRTDFSRRRAVLAATAAALAASFVALPAAADASTASVGAGKLTYTAAPGEANRVTVVPDGAGFTVTDPGATITPGSGCLGSGTQVTCSGVTNLRIVTGDGDDVIDSSQVALVASVDGQTGDDRITTGAGADNINAGDDSDTLDGGLGSDTLTGGPGNDVAAYTSHAAAQPVTINLDGVKNDGCTACGESDKISADVETLLGGAGDDTLVGNGSSNYLSGGLGNDTITGNGGADFIGYWERTAPVLIDFSTGTFGDPATGEHDTITDSIENAIGGSGADRLVGDDAVNWLWGGSSLVVPDGDDTFQGRGGADVFMGDQGSDTVEYSDRSAATSLNLSLDLTANDGAPGENDSLASGIENVTGGAGDDTITGDSGANVLTGGDGHDTIDGGAGDDTLAARDGVSDSLVCGIGADAGTADAADSIAADCEGVALPVVPPTVDPPTGDQPGGDQPSGDKPGGPGVDQPVDKTRPAPNSVPPSIPRQTAAVTANGVALVRITCPADSGGCRGTVSLELPAAKAPAHSKLAVSGARRRPGTKIGNRKFKAKAGKTVTVRVRLSKRGRQRILRNRRGRRHRVILSVATRTATGKVTTSSRTITLRTERRQPPRGRRGKR